VRELSCAACDAEEAATRARGRERKRLHERALHVCFRARDRA